MFTFVKAYEEAQVYPEDSEKFNEYQTWQDSDLYPPCLNKKLYVLSHLAFTVFIYLLSRVCVVVSGFFFVMCDEKIAPSDFLWIGSHS